MTYRIPRCLAQWNPYRGPNPIRCQLEAGHNGDHTHTTLHANATHTIAWSDTPDQLAHLRRQP